MLKILHFADLHLGASFRRFSGKGKELREGIKKSLINIVNIAKEEKVDLVISAGDIGDSNKLSPATVDFIVKQLGKLNVPVVILPGNHDCLDKSSLYLREQWSKLENIYLFTEEKGQTFSFPGLSLSVHGRATTAKTSQSSPLSGLTPSSDARWNIAMAHGSLQIEGKSAQDDFPVTFDDIASCSMDYIALGHWHNFYDFKHPKTLACYPGSASTLSFSHHDSGTVNLVELMEDGVSIKRIPSAHYKWKAVECSFEELEATLKENAGKECLLKLNVTGELLPERAADISNYIIEFEDAYFYLDINYNQLDEQELEIQKDKFPETTFVGQFLKLAYSKLESADPEEKPLLEKALIEGYKIATRGEVN